MFLLGCKRQKKTKNIKAGYDYNPSLQSVQCLILELTDLTLNPVSPKNVLFTKMRRRIRSFVAYYRTKVWKMFKNNVFDSNMAAIKCRLEYYSSLFR